MGLLLLSVLGQWGCGGDSLTTPTSTANPTPTPIPVPAAQSRPSPGEVASASTGRPIPGGRVDPALTSATPDNQVIDISAPGHYTLRTTRGFLRAKGDRIYLIPVDFDAEFFDMLYLAGNMTYTASYSQWDENPLRVLVDPAISATPLAARIARALSAINRLLELVDSPLRLEASTELTSPISMSIDPTLARPMGSSYLSRAFRRFEGRITFAESSPATDIDIYRSLFWMVSASQVDSSGRSFKSFSGTPTDAPTELDIAALRIHMNRCGGTRLEDDRGAPVRTRTGHESDLLQPTCTIPPSR